MMNTTQSKMQYILWMAKNQPLIYKAAVDRYVGTSGLSGMGDINVNIPFDASDPNAAFSSDFSYIPTSVSVSPVSVSTPATTSTSFVDSFFGTLKSIGSATVSALQKNAGAIGTALVGAGAAEVGAKAAQRQAAALIAVNQQRAAAGLPPTNTLATMGVNVTGGLSPVTIAALLGGVGIIGYAILKRKK